MRKVLVTESIHPEAFACLAEKMEAIVAPKNTRECLMEYLAMPGVEALLCRGASLDREMISVAHDLKIVSRHGVGVNMVDIDALTERGILLCNSPSGNVNSVSEHIVRLLLATSDNLRQLDLACRTGKFSQPGKSLPAQAKEQGFISREVTGKTLGIIGFGRIGSLAAEKCHNGFQMKILAYDPVLYGKRELPEGYEWVQDLDDLLRRSDYVSLSLHLTKDTYHLIGERELKLMKPTAILINCARGAIVDEMALAEALKNRTLAGAGIDVLSEEPINIHHPLFDCDTAIITPHAAAFTEESAFNLAQQSVMNILEFFDGKIPATAINRKELGL